MSWCRLSEGEIQKAWTFECQLMSNSCILTTKKRTEQRFNHITAKLIKCNVNNEYGFASAVRSAPDYKRTEKYKREAKKREKTAFILN